jgi:WD40 repeat protein
MMSMRSVAGSSTSGGGGISKAVFCSQEPHYLATGGASDGCVRLWDFRNTAVPRYAFDRVLAQPPAVASSSSSSLLPPTSVSALCFFADKRSIVYAGGSDGTLLALNAHGTAEDYLVSKAYCGPAPITGIVSPSGTNEIATSHGTGFGMPSAAAAAGAAAAGSTQQQPSMNGGVVQLRKAYKFQLLGQFSGPGTTAGINCLTLAPDGEKVCGAQLDETLKFWKVFEKRRPQRLGNNGSQTPPPAPASSSQQQQGAARITNRRQRMDGALDDDQLSLDLR